MIKAYRIILVALLSSCAIDNTIVLDRNAATEHVVLLHGIARSSKHMQSLASYLEKTGYHVINLDYPSTDYELEALVDIIHKDLTTKLKVDGVVHFVGYSMGGLLARAIIHKHKPQRLGRVVMLATPNQGSEVADALKENWLYKKFYGPAGKQLTTEQAAIEHLFGEIPYELGVIAGTRSIDPISSLFIIPGKDDGKVSVESTKLKGMKAHIVVPASHTFFPSNKQVQKQTAYFLRHGVFEEPPKKDKD